MGLGSSYSKRTWPGLEMKKSPWVRRAVRTDLDEFAGQRLHPGEIAVDAVDDGALFRAQVVRGGGFAEQGGERIEHRARRLRRRRALATWNRGSGLAGKGRRARLGLRKEGRAAGRGTWAMAGAARQANRATNASLQAVRLWCSAITFSASRPCGISIGCIWAGCGDFAASDAIRLDPA